VRVGSLRSFGAAMPVHTAQSRPRSKPNECSWVGFSGRRLRLLCLVRDLRRRGALLRHSASLMRRDDSESQTAVAVVWRALWTSRRVVLLSGPFAVLSFGRRPGTEAFDPANLTAPFGY